MLKLFLIVGGEVVQIPLSVDSGRIDIDRLKEKLGKEKFASLI